MRKFLFLFAATLIITSCSNKKKIDKTVDDTEDVSPKKKTSDDDPNMPKDHKKGDDDMTDDTKNNKDKMDDNNGGWSSGDETRFMDLCTGTAAPKVGAKRAKEYCSCMMEKTEKHFSSFSDADRNMSVSQRDAWAADCNNQ